MKKGFSLTEVIILIFTIAVIAAVLFPLKIIDLNQAERIAKWKTYYSELSYCYDVMQKSEYDFVKTYTENHTLNPEEYFSVFSKYLGIDELKTQNTNFSKYRKRFLNGKIIRQISKYKAKQFVYLKNGMIISFTGLARQKKEDPIGVLFVDVDASLKRNFIGRDIFVVLLFPNKIEPYGYNSTRQKMKEDCSPVGSGLQCSAYYLVGGAF